MKKSTNYILVEKLSDENRKEVYHSHNKEFIKHQKKKFEKIYGKEYEILIFTK